MNTTTTAVLHVDPRIHDALWARFVAPVLDGSEGFLHHCSLPGVEDPTELFPLGSVVTVATSSNGCQVLASTGEWTAIATRWAPRPADVWVRAADPDTLAKAVAELLAAAPVAEPEPDTVTVDFWQVADSAYTISRAIEAPSWADVVDHYPATVRTAMDELRERELTLHGGRILLWYGPPGTGKTSAIRALARAWRGIARFQIVLDADGLLGRAATLMEVLLQEDENDTRWRVLVIEDADELIRADAKDRVGQAFSRLLNIGDGIVGQGVRVLVLITTNEPVGALHPALLRPGRCLSTIEFRRFTRAEARAWRGDGLPAGDEFSLAELLVGPTQGEPAATVHTGLYL
jgi:hypothetical protein